MSDTDAEVRWPPRRYPKGCLWALGLVLALAAGLVAWSWYQRHTALQIQEAQARSHFEPALEKLEQGRTAQAEPDDYDLDKTVRVLHEIDAALTSGGSVETYLDTMALQDYRGVPADVIAARAEVLDVLFRLYSRQIEAEDQEATWAMIKHLGPVLNVLMISKLELGGDASLGIPLAGGGGSVQIAQAGIDREGVRQVYDDWKQQQADHLRMLRDLSELEQELVETLTDHGRVYHRYLQEWGELCALRDRAYLAAHSGNWDAAYAAASAAAEQAPNDREAHLLQALALIEGELSVPDQRDPEHLLDDYIAAHPDASAPALLLRGVLAAKRGKLQAARLDLEQSAATYPKQADLLQDMLDPYRSRSRTFLRKSREGNLVLALYKSSMLGAAWFSPDLQLARLGFEAGDFEGGRKKVMDHFARRRAQGQWDMVIRDLQFCESFLRDDYHLILPERGWLDLEVKEATFGDELEVAVANRSDKDLRNCSLVLCLHFTDMHPDDYETFTPRTEPELPAHETTTFDDVEVEFSLAGVDKTVDDIASIRAVLVSNEAVVWVDTVDFKRDQARQLREERMKERAGRRWNPAARPTAEANPLVDLGLTSLEQGAKLATSRELGKDDVHVELPYLFSVLAPVFSLDVNGERVPPTSNNIVGDSIELSFDEVANFDDGSTPTVMLMVDTFLTELVLTWAQDPDGNWRFQGTTRSD